MPVDDYYHLFGVSPDADRDTIREAYRAKRDALNPEDADDRAQGARLNQAWNVLSDAAQRERYDEQLAAARAEDGYEIPPPPGADAPALTGRAAVRAERERQRMERMNRPAGPYFVGTVPVAPPKKRMIAFAIDTVVLAVLVIAGYTIGGRMSIDAYPNEYRELRALTREAARLETIKDLRSAEADKADAEEELAAAERADDEAAIEAAQEDIESADDDIAAANDDRKEQLQDLDEALEDARADRDEADIDALVQEQEQAANELELYTSESKADNRLDDVTERTTDLQKETSGPFLRALLVAFLAGLLVTAVPSAIRGQTLGKAIMRLRLVMEDGSPAGWRGSLVHYGLPIVFVALSLTVIPLGPIGLMLAIWGVTTWARNPKQQGWHDRVAHTLVADDTIPMQGAALETPVG